MFIKILPNKNILETNFKRCNSWEERYLYIIELGHRISILSQKHHSLKNLIHGCQSQVWITLKIDSNNHVLFKGYSDSSIVQGLLAIIFIFYNNKTYNEIIQFNIQSYFKKLSLDKYLSLSRLQGIEVIINTIKKKIIELINK
ncbi:cysteine desulfuration protein SufE [Enterobacteriaceae endosymbiont of Plateumaris braccata]|uniref:cysteine desulfuration protein SufE n=1 Tax=Enterobacteriaceae endosymbiont of Plateumaris braccata TaxID=2675793 RepID=UPI001449623A|nr:cysteine desulfuration protein SufE [Enterobacteriaceae endosymbiont of Plateumaris braccata]QJC28305.1 cysteine desulfuration protein SufE [Enterobacteriaceae endosymbiont of Plateumaris braccata]